MVRLPKGPKKELKGPPKEPKGPKKLKGPKNEFDTWRRRELSSPDSRSECCTPSICHREREFFIDNLLVRIHLIIEMILAASAARPPSVRGLGLGYTHSLSLIIAHSPMLSHHLSLCHSRPLYLPLVSGTAVERMGPHKPAIAARSPSASRECVRSQFIIETLLQVDLCVETVIPLEPSNIYQYLLVVFPIYWSWCSSSPCCASTAVEPIATHTLVKARFWPLLEPFSARKSLNPLSCSLLARCSACSNIY